jgi:hypothetical protein
LNQGGESLQGVRLSLVVSKTMSWRDRYKVHPAADVFPLLSETDPEAFEALVEDVGEHGVRVPIGFFIAHDVTWLIDGRNRLEAAERVGLDLDRIPTAEVHCSDPVTWVIALNIRRRHLTKQQQADLIVAAHKAGSKPRQVGEVSEAKWEYEPFSVTRARDSDGAIDPEVQARLWEQHAVEVYRKRARRERNKGGRGKIDSVKAAAVATAKEHGISKRTVERAIAKAEGRKPKVVTIVGDEDSEDTPQDMWRRGLLHRANEATELGFRDDWSGFVADAEMVMAAEKAGRAWLELADYLRTLVPEPRRPRKKCHGTETVTGKSGIPFDCDCVRAKSVA